ncbi:MAG: glycosyl transferase family 1 [Chloroflexota bacterium]|nr:MAG: glycosyl transferase family 1 [Chloroflexota bacterium]
MNILHLYKDYHPIVGGIENYIKVLAEAQAAANHQVTVLACNPGLSTCTEIINQVRILKAGRLITLASMPLSIAQPLALTQLRADVIHIHTPYPLGEAANWLLGRSAFTVITYHSDVVRQRTLLRFYAPLFRRVLRAADRIIATSPSYINTSPWLQSVREKCTVVPLGIDVTRFSPAASHSDSEPLEILFVGRLRYYKGLDTLFHALIDVPQARLTIVGTGPMQASWQALAQELALSDRVTFVGEIDDTDLPEQYRRANLFVLPANTRAEAFGTVLLEAMASGLPCITTELGTGTSWVVQHGVTGLIVPPREPAALAEAIKTFQTNLGLRQQFGQAALVRVRTEFSQEVMIDGVMRVYEELLTTRRTKNI